VPCWKGLGLMRILFPVLVGPEVDNPTRSQRSISAPHLASGLEKLVPIAGVWWGTRDRREFYFRSRCFRFRPGCNHRFFRVNFRACSDLRTTSRSTWMRSQHHARGLDNKTASGRSSSGSDRSETEPRPDIEVGQLEEAGKPVGFILQSRFTDISWKTQNYADSLSISKNEISTIELLIFIKYIACDQISFR